MVVAVMTARYGGDKSDRIGKKPDKDMAKAQIKIPFNIPDVRMLQTSMGERGEIIITIESIKKGTACRKCGRWITKSHRHDEWVMMRHLPAFGCATYLRYRPKRYQCQDCEGHPTTTQSLEWHDSNSLHSFVYDNHILLQLVNSTVEDVSVKKGLSYASVVGTLERRMDASVNWTMMADIDTLGLDEIALRKGQGHYVTLVTGRYREGEILSLGVLPGHEKAEMVEFLRLTPQGSCKLCMLFVAIYGKPISKRFAKRSQRHGSLQIAFTLPDTIARPLIK